MTTMLQFTALILLAIFVIAGCEAQRDNSAAPAEGEPQTFTGTLQGGMMAIGGETSGWMLQRDDGNESELDPRNLTPQQLEPLDGQRVRVTGREETKEYVERGRVQVIVVERIEPLQGP
jgi:hypothetical protein